MGNNGVMRRNDSYVAPHIISGKAVADGELRLASQDPTFCMFTVSPLVKALEEQHIIQLCRGPRHLPWMPPIAFAHTFFLRCLTPCLRADFPDPPSQSQPVRSPQNNPSRYKTLCTLIPYYTSCGGKNIAFVGASFATVTKVVHSGTSSAVCFRSSAPPSIFKPRLARAARQAYRAGRCRPRAVLLHERRDCG